MDPDEAARRWQDHGGCILWLEDYTKWRVDGLAVAPRGDKLRSWFDWQPQGWARFEDGLMAAVWRMQGPPFGQSAPRPGSPWAGDRKR
jgi:hypothetical protein